MIAVTARPPGGASFRPVLSGRRFFCDRADIALELGARDQHLAPAALAAYAYIHPRAQHREAVAAARMLFLKLKYISLVYLNYLHIKRLFKPVIDLFYHNTVKESSLNIIFNKKSTKFH